MVRKIVANYSIEHAAAMLCMHLLIMSKCMGSSELVNGKYQSEFQYYK